MTSMNEDWESRMVTWSDRVPISRDPETWQVSKSTSVNDPNVPLDVKRQEIREYFHKTYSQHESLYDVLVDDKYMYEKSIPLRHPLIFYYCHTAAFFINKLFLGKFIRKRVNPELEWMVAVGVDEMSWDDCNEQHYDWPSMDIAKNFRALVRDVVDDVISTAELVLPVEWDHAFWPVLMGIEHERIHLETSSVLLRQHKVERVRNHPIWGKLCPHQDRPAPENELVAVPAGEVVYGKQAITPETYGWDNEYGTRKEAVAALKASKYLVSNAEFMQFVKAGGYQERKYWSDHGWGWVQDMSITHPEFWVKDGSGYRYRTLLQVIDMPWSWPVDCNNLEANAFCKWKAEKDGVEYRLPSEAEWYYLVKHSKVPDQPHWKKAPGNVNLEYWASSCPVDMFKQGDFFDLVGNVWTWTETQFDALDGEFRFHPLYHDFSTPTFDTKHYVIKNGSFISTGNESCQSSRYAFRPHFFQHAGFRYITSSSSEPVKQTANKLWGVVGSGDRFAAEATAMQYMEMHYGDVTDKNYLVQCAKVVNQYAEQLDLKESAVDVGCAVGRLTFELSRRFETVLGVDKSQRLILSALDMQQLERLLWSIPDEAELHEARHCNFNQLGLSDDSLARISFAQMDAEEFSQRPETFDVLVLSNLLDYVEDPVGLLNKLKARVRVGGLLVITSAYLWSEKFTPRKNWLGGFVGSNTDKIYSRPVLTNVMTTGGAFKLYGEPCDVDYSIRKTKRKYQRVVTELTAWQRQS